jgi:ankyrin repeat protein
MFAAQEGLVDEVKALLEAGADANIKDRDGDTALMAATREGHQEIIALLRKA